MADYNKPLPIPSQESRPYWDGLREQKLLMPRCDACGRFWFPPSLFTNVSQSYRIAREEIFGPVLSVMPFASVDDAVKLYGGPG